MKHSRVLKNLNKLEKSYAALFVLSLLAGILYGIADKSYFKCCENAIGVPEGGTSALKIFSGNLFLSLIELATAGLFSLYFNFHTLSVTSSYLNATGTLLVLPVILFVGIFELAGGLLFGLAGLASAEKNLLKIKSKLKPGELFLYGASLIFIGAVFEYLLVTLV